MQGFIEYLEKMDIILAHKQKVHHNFQTFKIIYICLFTSTIKRSKINLKQYLKNSHEINFSHLKLLQSSSQDGGVGRNVSFP